MKQAFTDVSVRGMDCELIVLMPETSVEELDILLKPLYGIYEDSVSTANIGSNIFGIDFNKIERSAEKKTFALPQSGNKTTPPAPKRGRPRKNPDYLSNYYNDNLEESESLDTLDYDYGDDDFEVKSSKKKRGRPPKKIKTEHDDNSVVMPAVKVKEEVDAADDDEFIDSKEWSVEASANYNQDSVGLYHCTTPGCDFRTFIRASVQQHSRHSHSGDGFKLADLHFTCGRCGEMWSNQQYYNKHLDTNICLGNSERPYICETCGEGWYNLTNYTKHTEAKFCQKSDNSTSKQPCPNEACDLSFFSSINRDTHVKKTHWSGTAYKCAKCDLSFTIHKDFANHRKTVHSAEHLKKGFSCRIPGCSFDGEKRDLLAAHVKEAHPEKDHICIDCGKNFPERRKLLTHMAGKKCTPVNYDCPHCPRQFNRKRHMELHVLFKHSQDRPFSCEECGKRFKTRHCVNIHLRSHGIGGYSWCCEECGKTFNQISAYHVHLKVHSNIRDFACETCGMTFKLKHSLKKHQLVHKQEFGHTCDFCGKKFKRSDNLINHRRRHTGEHPYRCDKCSWTGPDSSSAIHHKKKHANTTVAIQPTIVQLPRTT